jgi:hypothetical protein
MAAPDYVPIFFRNRLHLAGRLQMGSRPSKIVDGRRRPAKIVKAASASPSSATASGRSVTRLRSGPSKPLLEFVAKVFLSHEGFLVGSPLYVSYAQKDPSAEKMCQPN